MPTRAPIVLMVQRKDDAGSFANNPVALHSSIIARIETVVPVVSHHKILAFGNTHWPKAAFGGNPGKGGDHVWASLEGLDRKKTRRPIRDDTSSEAGLGNRFVLHRLAVEDKIFVAQFEQVTGQPDHPLHQPLPVIG